jgi:Fur family transcriptional regulator, ferric uptake regulator
VGKNTTSNLKLEPLLRSLGFRVTQTRISVLKCLMSKGEALTPMQILEQVMKEDTSIDKVTVYRILEAFEESGLIHKTHSGSYIYCDHNSQDSESFANEAHYHYHLVLQCSKCNKTTQTDLPSNYAVMLDGFLQTLGYTSANQVIQLDGTCAQCN